MNRDFNPCASPACSACQEVRQLRALSTDEVRAGREAVASAIWETLSRHGIRERGLVEDEPAYAIGCACADAVLALPPVPVHDHDLANRCGPRCPAPTGGAA